MVHIRRFDIRFAVTYLNFFSMASMESHLKRLVNIFGYLKDATGIHKSIVISLEDIREISGKGDNTADWLDKYPDTSDDIDEGFPELRGSTLSTTVYFDSDHAHDQVTWRSVSGVMCFVGLTPISRSKRVRVPSRSPATPQSSAHAG